jgi:transposase
MNRVRIGRCSRPQAVAGDKGYSYEGIRDWLREHAIRAVIPRRKDQRPDDRRHRFDRERYRRRSVVEQCVGWLKQCRRLCTRFEKLAVNFLAMIHLALIERYLRVAFSDTT